MDVAGNSRALLLQQVASSGLKGKLRQQVQTKRHDQTAYGEDCDLKPSLLPEAQLDRSQRENGGDAARHRVPRRHAKGADDSRHGPIWAGVFSGFPAVFSVGDDAPTVVRAKVDYLSIRQFGVKSGQDTGLQRIIECFHSQDMAPVSFRSAEISIPNSFSLPSTTGSLQALPFRFSS